MTREEFEKKVFQMLHSDEYSGDKPEAYLIDAMKEYADVVDDGYEISAEEGFDYGIEYAARNISMCI